MSACSVALLGHHVATVLEWNHMQSMAELACVFPDDLAEGETPTARPLSR